MNFSLATSDAAAASGAAAVAIAIEGLTKSFHGTRVLKGVSLTIREGDFATILGPSGSGKTTILRCIAGLEDPDGGRIVLNGETVFDAARGINIPTHRRRLGMIFQNYALWPHMTILQHVVFPLRQQRRADAAALARQALAVVGLESHAAKFPHQLSGGQQQRVAVARAIVADPSVLLMDEPLSNLDVQLRRQLRDELKAAHLRSRATSVFVTHDQAEAFALSDYLVVMRDGEIVQKGQALDLRHRPRNGFIARFLGYDNVLAGADLLRLPALTRLPGLDPDRSYAIDSTAIRTAPSQVPGELCLEGAVLVASTFDGLVHSRSFDLAGLRLETKSLDKPGPEQAAGPVALWLRPADIASIAE